MPGRRRSNHCSYTGHKHRSFAKNLPFGAGFYSSPTSVSHDPSRFYLSSSTPHTFLSAPVTSRIVKWTRYPLLNELPIGRYLNSESFRRSLCNSTCDERTAKNRKMAICFGIESEGRVVV